MPLSRTPSPPEQGDWSSPGLTSAFVDGGGRPSSSHGSQTPSRNGTPVTWESAKKKSQVVNGGGYTPFAKPQRPGFFHRNFRRLSSSLPRFNIGRDVYSYAEKEKLGRGRWQASNGTKIGRLVNTIMRTILNLKLRYIVVLLFVFAYILFYSSRRCSL